MTISSKSYLLISSTIVIICTCVISLTKATKLGFSVELMHLDSPQSPFYDNSTTPFQKLYNAFHRSMKRANRFFPDTKALDEDPEAELSYASGEYIMAYSLGTDPSFQIYGVVDTGSDLTWLQCIPCYICYQQKIPVVDLSASKTFGKYDCYSNQCKTAAVSVSRTYCDIYTACQFNISYVDGSSSMGFISHDTLTLASTSGGKVAFPNTLIGCAHETVGRFSPESSGIIGLGRGPISLISQTTSSIEGKFSYCLNPAFSEKNSKLHFGQRAIVSGPGTVSTPLVAIGLNLFYFVTLEGISVGDKRIKYNIDGQPLVEGNTVIDSGSRLTVLPREFYSAVESEVVARIKSDRISDPRKFLNLCYVAESIQSLGAPIITLHFRGAGVQLDPMNTFIVISTGVICFAFLGYSRTSLIGNLAQVNLMVGFDIKNNLVSFKPMDCSMF